MAWSQFNAISRVTHNSIDIHFNLCVPPFDAENCVPRFFALVFFCSSFMMKLCQMTKTYLLVHNVIGEVMRHVTYYLSLSSLTASAHTDSLAAVINLTNSFDFSQMLSHSQVWVQLVLINNLSVSSDFFSLLLLPVAVLLVLLSLFDETKIAIAACYCRAEYHSNQVNVSTALKSLEFVCMRTLYMKRETEGMRERL